MSSESTSTMRVWRRALLTGVSVLGGLALFAVAVDRVGVQSILDGARRVGWPGAVTIFALAGLRFALRAESWRLCMRRDRRLSLPRTFAAFLSGDALGNVTPLGMLASEPAKVYLSRVRLDTREAIASLAIDNLVYAASAIAMVVLGVVVALAVIPLPTAWTAVGGAAVVAALVALAIGWRVMQGTWASERGERPAWRERLSSLRRSVVAFAVEQPGRLQRVVGVDVAFHALAIVEVYLVLGALLGDRRPSLAYAVVFEALNRFVTVAFKFIPFRVGVDEAFSGGLASLVTIDPATGVTLAVLRKARNLAWTAVGLALIAASPARGSREPDRPGGV